MIVDFVDAQQATDRSRPVPMDLSALALRPDALEDGRSKGSGKKGGKRPGKTVGKGYKGGFDNPVKCKGKKGKRPDGGKNSGFQGFCCTCGKWGHTMKECRGKGAGKAYVLEAHGTDEADECDEPCSWNTKS